MLQNLLNEGIHRTATHAAMVPGESVRSLGAIREDSAVQQHLPMAPSQQHMEAMPWTPGLGPQEKPAEVVPRLPTSMRQLSERMEPDQKVEFPQEWHDNLDRMRVDLVASPASSPSSGMFDSSPLQGPPLMRQPDFSQIAWRYCMQSPDYYQPPRMMPAVPAPRRSIREDYEVIVVDNDGTAQEAGAAEGKGSESGDGQAARAYISPSGEDSDGADADDHANLTAAVKQLRSMIHASGGGSGTSRRRSSHGFPSPRNALSPSARRASITSSRRSSLEATGSVVPVEDGDDLFASRTVLATAASGPSVVGTPRGSPSSVARGSSGSHGDASSHELGVNTDAGSGGSGILASPPTRFTGANWTSGSLILQDALVAEPVAALAGDGRSAGASGGNANSSDSRASHSSGASPSLGDARDDGSTGGTGVSRTVRWDPLVRSRRGRAGGSARVRRRSKGDRAGAGAGFGDGGSRHSV